ncbi:PoNe immunity protein domain-containing protein [Mucilaginibacter flavus]|uniref:PoNe immunity protein domain-containing protein n=1 Tax=Mucilaginibacter flavus TaxID=931504 RepID=UPI0025B3B3D6|nr:PoNe immunity protein domain-containing protein [Mucilaginibacter flavus]MDN3581245.1 DUF1911 domain-containing protein [Mucilaginibacter flavus]
MMKREPLLNLANLKSCRADFESEITENKEQLASRPPEIKSWDTVYAILSDTQLRYAIYKYSEGGSIKDLAQLVTEATQNYIAYQNYPPEYITSMKDLFLVYQEYLTILSLNILVKSDRELMEKLAAVCDTLGSDKLTDIMLSYVLPDRKIAGKLLWPKSFEKLYSVFDAKKEQQPEIIAAYLSGWYKNMSKAPWYNSHKNTENQCAFIGYWSFESAAVVCLLNIDDTSFRDKLFYPKDFADFNRNL